MGISPLTFCGFPGGSVVKKKKSAYNAGDVGSIPGLGRTAGEGHGNPGQYSSLENPMDRGAWWVNSQTWLSVHTAHDPVTVISSCCIPL